MVIMLRIQNFIQVLVILILMIDISLQAKKQKSLLLTDIDNIKDHKKLLKSKTNILILYVNSPKQSTALMDLFKSTADTVKGQATLVSVDCSTGESKKLCKKLKIASDVPYVIKHYKDGEFHKDYDRKETVASMTNFLRDPTGELPWEEDPQAADIYHIQDEESLTKFLRKGSGANINSLVLFYAPWCGYCKILKPEYISAAAELKGEYTLAAMDLAKPGNSKIRQLYNITGFPTIIYFEKGLLRFPYNGDNKKDAIVRFMRDPTAVAETKAEEPDESWSTDNDVTHLTGTNFDSVISKNEHVLVVFYAPWCGHCKRIKPELEKAATRVKKESINGVLAAVDATKNPDIASRFGVKGYPTLKYFHKGEFRFDAGHVRQEEAIVSFIKDPQEPPPPPPPERPWADEESHVRHLNAATFRNTLRKIKHALVMFYAPWCGHCKKAKTEFMRAAERFADELFVVLGAVDCTQEKDLCQQYHVTGYPTFKYFSFYDKEVKDYSGDRKDEAFASFIFTEIEKAMASTNVAAGFGVNVELLTDANFETIIKYPNATFVMFFASWCSHCAKVKPTFSKIATEFKTENVPIKVVAIDAAENSKVADLASIESLPTFKVYVAGKEVAEYSGDRSYDDLKNFALKHKVTVREEL